MSEQALTKWKKKKKEPIIGSYQWCDRRQLSASEVSEPENKVKEQ